MTCHFSCYKPLSEIFINSEKPSADFRPRRLAILAQKSFAFVLESTSIAYKKNSQYVRKIINCVYERIEMRSIIEYNKINNNRIILINCSNTLYIEYCDMMQLPHPYRRENKLCERSASSCAELLRLRPDVAQTFADQHYTTHFEHTVISI